MTTASQPWTEEMVTVGGVNLQLFKGGSGEPLLVLHDEMGHPGWLGYHQALAQNYTLHLPSHPGFGESDQLDWVMGMRDLAQLAPLRHARRSSSGIHLFWEAPTRTRREKGTILKFQKC